MSKQRHNSTFLTKSSELIIIISICKILSLVELTFPEREMKKITVAILVLATLSSCAISIKANKYFKQGKTVQQNFKETIPFRIKDGHIILTVNIKDKDYDFMLDTGASNLVSKELAEELGLKVLGSEKVGDVYNNTKTQEYVGLESIQIGEVEFVETAALIFDFNSVEIWDSLGVDGFIGSNLMQHAIWDFDFTNNEVTITDDESKLSIPDDFIENKLFIGVAGVPSIACELNGEKVWNFTLDFGFSGGVVVPFSEFNKQVSSGQITEFKKSETNGVVGMYGKQDFKREFYLGLIDEIEFGNNTLINQEVYAEQYLEKMFGLAFFRNYRVVLNWDSKKVKLIEKSNPIVANETTTHP